LTASAHVPLPPLEPELVPDFEAEVDDVELEPLDSPR
jgi:hypothetical protein